MFKKLFFLTPLFLMVGCSSRLEINRSTEKTPQELENTWAHVLATHVNDKGQIDFRAIQKDSVELDEYVASVTKFSPFNTPELFPSKNEQLAYHLNSYNALAMYNAVHSGHLPKQVVRFFILTKFKIGDKKLSLYSYENDVIRKLEEPRIHFALNCMVKGCPRLPQESFQAAVLNDQLEKLTKEFLNETRNVRMDKDKQEVWLSSILKFYTKDFLTQAPTLLAYINTYRDEKIPETYKIKFIPYDFTLNQL